MPTIANTVRVKTDLDRGVVLTRLGRLFAQADSGAHEFRIEVLRQGEEVDLTGAEITGFFIRADEYTVPLEGEAEDSTAVLKLISACYETEGWFSLVVKAARDGEVVTLFWADGCVTRTETDSVVDPARKIPSLAELLAKIGDMERGTAAAPVAAGAASEAAESANEAASAASGAAASASAAAASASEAASDAVAAASSANTAAASAGTAATDANTAAAAAGSAATAASSAAQLVTDALIPDLSDVTTITVAAGQNASVTIDTTGSGTLHNPKVTFSIPRGIPGEGAVTSIDGLTPGTDGSVTLPLMGPAAADAAGSAGKVPPPAAGDQNAFLKGDATWYRLNVRNGTGTDSVVQGTNTYASGNYSHAEGWGSSASEATAHAEGYLTSAQRGYSHAEGYRTVADGSGSHVEGYFTKATHKSQHVFGEYNEEDPSEAAATQRGTYIEIVGNGTSTSDVGRANARTLDWSGHEVLSGQMTAAQFNGSGAGLTGVVKTVNGNAPDANGNVEVEGGGGGGTFDPLLCYPVGAIYISVVETSPSMLFGGTWERLEGRFLLAATIGGAEGVDVQGDRFVAPGSTGGEATHLLTVAEMPSHTHTQNSHSHSVGYRNISDQSGSTSRRHGPYGQSSDNTGNVSSAGTTATNNSTGGSQSHNNMPPFLAVYMWKRLS